MAWTRFRDPAGSVRTGEWNGESVSFGGTTYDLDEVNLLSPVSPSKIICIGLNYEDHAAEVEMELPERPMLFLKGPNAVASHGASIPLLPTDVRIDYEAEMGVVIDEQCRHVDASDAMDFVAGYTCLNDISNRHDQEVEQNWIRAKAFDGSLPVGPAVVPPEEIPDDASVQLHLNGETKQDSDLSQLIFSIPELIEEITTYMTLEPGDIIATGTPAGIGSLSAGDTVSVEIEGIGTLQNDIVSPP
ncbi:fumarylacetoacetate hydrolase family protein [Natronorubrum sp. FCH18a]|uniref:fumarylacetoacetate hydrolase family protein n=1 Tax=Natronorubrum sp. FCH18a TaxID=3447018 RepID=UPI003F5125D1